MQWPRSRNATSASSVARATGSAVVLLGAAVAAWLLWLRGGRHHRLLALCAVTSLLSRPALWRGREDRKSKATAVQDGACASPSAPSKSQAPGVRVLTEQPVAVSAIVDRPQALTAQPQPELLQIPTVGAEAVQLQASTKDLPALCPPSPPTAPPLAPARELAPKQVNGEAEPVVTGNFVLLALFDGIRGCSVALRSLGVEPFVDYSSEVDNNCRRFIAAKYPRCVQLGDVRKISEDVLTRLIQQHGVERPWLVVGGSPCQDLSRRRGPNRRGLSGKKSKLFFEFLRIVSMLKSAGVKTGFLLENVASMDDEERDVISDCLGVDPLYVDSVVVSACHRQRYYWTNIPTSAPEPREVDVDALLDEGWMRNPPGKPFRCFVASAARESRLGRGDFGGVVNRVDASARAPNADEREAILGFPRGHTRMPMIGDEDSFCETHRLKLIGNSFSVQVVAHIISAFADYAKGDAPLVLQPLRKDARVFSMNRFIQEEVADDVNVDSDEEGRPVSRKEVICLN
eukprot:TRINITY_DN9945_c0_g1_i2.p1 TRINITY_DN9945_c0_g1~~TRINITY_DN9945_c0_g1_i2.p1  ORF type:complete len:515 (-),score=90.56 TRINITY_DN9945_c0_g1_i2:67-1611(-)